jgi:very-short-patch-repair endonuclease
MTRDAKKINAARALRKSNVPAEGIMWKILRNRALGGFKFRRQHPIGRYDVDFACVECKVIIELDGETHLPRKEADTTRTQFLEADSWHVLRFWNTAVYDELEVVKKVIFQACDQRRVAG